jgi:hypothetical protein
MAISGSARARDARFGKPNVTRAVAAAYKALKRSYGEEPPAAVEDLFAVASAIRDQAREAD